jgi:acyl-coenzyme A synthetase/AMP-(fatty) acid ligase
MSKLIDQFFYNILDCKKNIITDRTYEPEITYLSGARLITLIDKFCGFLLNLDLGEDKKIISICDNTLESAVILLSCMRGGFCTYVLPPTIKDQEIFEIIKFSPKAKIIDCSRQNLNETSVHEIINFDWKKIEQLPVNKPIEVPENSPLTVTFTSGTTGKPKGIIHSAESYLKCAYSFNEMTGISGEDTFLNVMPMHYMAGIFNGIFAPLTAIASVVIDKAFDTKMALNFWKTVNEYNITSLWLSPSMLIMIMKLDRTDKRLPPLLKNIFVGTGSLAPDKAHLFLKEYGLPPLQSYGLSELLYVSVDKLEEFCFDYTGTLLPGIGVTIDDSGLALIDSPYRCLGWIEDGEFYELRSSFQTSDLVFINSQGRLKINGRSDELIVRGGVNINPISIEKEIKNLPGQTNFCISSFLDEILGESLVLVVQGEIDNRNADLLKAYCNKILNKKGRISIDHVAFVEMIPVTTTGKIKRKKLKLNIAKDRL